MKRVLSYPERLSCSGGTRVGGRSYDTGSGSEICRSVSPYPALRGAKRNTQSRASNTIHRRYLAHDTPGSRPLESQRETASQRPQTNLENWLLPSLEISAILVENVTSARRCYGLRSALIVRKDGAFMATTDNPTSSDSPKQLYCPVCGRPLLTFQQRDYRNRQCEMFITFGTCTTPYCLLYHQTLSVRSLLGDLASYEVAEASYDVLTGAYIPSWARVWWPELLGRKN